MWEDTMGKAEIFTDNLLAVTFLLPPCNAFHLSCPESLIPPWLIHSKDGKQFWGKTSGAGGEKEKKKLSVLQIKQ